MASYGPIYEFAFDSQNGADILIVISKKSYVGEVTRRPLGRAPILKRENNGHVYGTSLEIYAECKVDGEYAEFYTSSADEFLVEVYKDEALIWVGFITPELYSEPDIAPPYDVQIIATDGLGELRNFNFIGDGDITISDHLSQLISHTGLSLETVMASDLRYYDGEVASDAVDILDFRVDLSHEDGESCYDVLQNLLSSLNASITQFNGKWFIFRETDFIGLASADGLKAFAPGGSETFMDIATFGSAKTCQWWPVGQLSSVIEPAKNRLTLISPNNYKNNVLNGSWTSANGAVYDEAESAYILPDEGSYITQKIDFAGNEVGYRLALRVSARNVGSGEEDQALGVRVVIDGRSYAGERQYWLIQPESSDRGIGSYMWKTSEGSVEADLAVPSDSDTSADAQDIDIILPLYRNDNRSYIYAKTVEVTVFNPAGIHDIYVYGVSLSKYDQFEGYQANVVLENGAREEGSSIDLSLSDGAMTPAAGNIFMSGIPLHPDADEAIVSWGIGLSEAEDYIGLMSKDYSRQVALPRMSYKGILNVPRAAIPALFLRDNTYYFPRTYTYDLYNDELEVDLISIPAADLTIDTIQVGQIAQSQGVPSSGGSGGGGGIGGGVDLSGYARKEEVTTLADLLASMWSLDDDGNLVTDRNVIIKKNVTIGGDTSTGGTGEDPGVSGTVTGIRVDDNTILEPTNGIVDMSDVLANLEVDVDLSDYYTSEQTDAQIANAVAGLNLGQYAKASDLAAYKAWWDDVMSLVVKEGNDIKIKTNLIIAGDQSTGGEGESVVSGITGIKLNGTTYKDENNDGIIDLGTITGGLTSVSWSDVQGRPTKVSEFLNDSGFITSAALLGYATQSWVEGKGYITGIDKPMVASAVGSSGNAGKVLSSTGGDLGWVSLPTSLPASDVYAWAKAANKPSYTTSEVTEGTNLYFTNARAVSALSGALANYLPLTGYKTLTGTIEFNNSAPAIKFYRASGVPYVRFGASASSEYGELGVKSNGDLAFWSLISSNSAYNNWYTLIHSGNIGSYNAGSATKLATARTIWGQSFDGTADLEGSIDNCNWIRYYTGSANSGYIVGRGEVITGGNGLGLWTYGNTPIFFGTSSATRMLINSSGNVLIGTTTDSGEKLQVEGWVSAKYGYRTYDSGDYGIWNGGRYSGSLEKTDIAYYATKHAFHVGNVLIGTMTDSGYKLDVNGAARISGVLTVGGSIGTGGDVNVGGVFGVTSDISKFNNHLYIKGASSYLYINSEAAGIYLTGTSITWHNASNQWAASLINFASNAITLNQPVTMSAGATVANSISVGESIVVNNGINITGGGNSLCGLFKNGFITSSGNAKTLWIYNQAPITVYGNGGTSFSGGDVTINGNLVVTGDTSTGSDIRFKDKLSDHRIALSDIAEAPLFTFKWNDREDDNVHLGTSAQYWEKVTPWLVKGDEFKTLDYASLGVAIGISLANKTLNHEERIKILENKIKALELENRRLKYGS